VHFIMNNSPNVADNGAPEDNYAIDDLAFEERMKYWTNGSVDDLHLYSVQLAITLEAGRLLLTYKSNSKVAVQEDYLKEKYDEIVDRLSSVDGFLTSGQIQKLNGPYYGSKGKDKTSPSGKQIRDKYLTVKSKVLNEIAPKLPNNYHMLASGTGIVEAFDKFVKNIYIQKNPDNLPAEELLDSSLVVPFGYEYLSKSYPLCCMLAFKTNYKWTGLVNDVSDSLKGKKMSRAEIKMLARKKKVEKIRKKNDDLHESVSKKTKLETFDIVRKSELNKTLRIAQADNSWETRANILTKTLEVAERMYGREDEKVKLIYEKLVEHTLSEPEIPDTPEKVRNLEMGIIDLTTGTSGARSSPTTHSSTPSNVAGQHQYDGTVLPRQLEASSNTAIGIVHDASNENTQSSRSGNTEDPFSSDDETPREVALGVLSSGLQIGMTKHHNC